MHIKMCRRSRHIFLLYENILDARAVPYIQISGPEDAAGSEPRTPVPSELVNRLADISLWIGMRSRVPGIFLRNSFRGFHRCRKDNPKVVCTFMKPCLDVKSPFLKHAVRRSNPLPVEEDCASCIQSLKNQLYIFTRQSRPG